MTALIVRQRVAYGRLLNTGQTFLEVMISLFLVMFMVIVFHEFQAKTFMQAKSANRSTIMLSLASSSYDYEQLADISPLKKTSAEQPAKMGGYQFFVQNAAQEIVVSGNNRADFMINKYSQLSK